MEVRLIYPPRVFRGNEEVDYDLYAQYMRTKKVGDRIYTPVAAPGTGHVVEEITCMDSTGIYGFVTENPTRELGRWEVV